MNIEDYTYWNSKAYGKALILSNRLPKTHRIIMAFVCLITPFTNWMIPFLFMNKIVIRYNGE